MLILFYVAYRAKLMTPRYSQNPFCPQPRQHCQTLTLPRPIGNEPVITTLAAAVIDFEVAVRVVRCDHLKGRCYRASIKTCELRQGELEEAAQAAPKAAVELAYQQAAEQSQCFPDYIKAQNRVTGQSRKLSKHYALSRVRDVLGKTLGDQKPYASSLFFS